MIIHSIKIVEESANTLTSMNTLTNTYVELANYVVGKVILVFLKFNFRMEILTVPTLLMTQFRTSNYSR